LKSSAGCKRVTETQSIERTFAIIIHSGL